MFPLSGKSASQRPSEEFICEDYTRWQWTWQIWEVGVNTHINNFMLPSYQVYAHTHRHTIMHIHPAFGRCSPHPPSPNPTPLLSAQHPWTGGPSLPSLVDKAHWLLSLLSTHTHTHAHKLVNPLLTVLHLIRAKEEQEGKKRLCSCCCFI